MRKEFVTQAKGPAETKKRPFQQKNARRITLSLRYKQPFTENAAYPGPGRGVSGESTN